MPTEQIIALLIAEQDRINRAIEALSAPVKRLGRPPKSAGAITANKSTRLKRTAAQRQAQAERMRAYWAAKKKGKK